MRPAEIVPRHQHKAVVRRAYLPPASRSGGRTYVGEPCLCVGVQEGVVHALTATGTIKIAITAATPANDA